MVRLIILSFVICHLSLPAWSLVAAPKEWELPLPPKEIVVPAVPRVVASPETPVKKRVEKLPAPEIEVKTPLRQPSQPRQLKNIFSLIISIIILVIVIIVLTIALLIYPKKREE